MSLTFTEGVHAQPGNLQAAARATADALHSADLTPFRAGTLVLSGIGASWHALAPALHALRGAGRRAFAVPSAELAQAGAARLGDAYVVVSQSGRSTEPIAAVETLKGAPLAVVSAAGDSPLAHAADVWLPLGDVPDTPLSTLAYTATLQTLGLFCDALTQRNDTEWERIPDLSRAVLDEQAQPAQQAATRLQGILAVDAVGGGALVGTAGETALLAREGLRVPSYDAETRQYLHGPLEAVDERFGAFVFGNGRELELAGALASYGATVIGVTDVTGAHVPDAQLFVLPTVGELAKPILQILPVQLIVGYLAQAWGLPADGLRRHQDDTKAA